MNETAIKLPGDRKLYGLILILGVLIDLTLLSIGLLLNAANILAYPSNLFALAPYVLVSLAMLIIGCFTLRASRPGTILMLRTATIIGVLAGLALGPAIVIAASGPNEASLGVALYSILPLPILIESVSWSSTDIGTILLSLSPHIIAILVQGITAFWIARRTGSVKLGIGCTVFIAMMTILFTMFTGNLTLLITNKWSVLSYDNWYMLFTLPLAALMEYALTIGVIGAFVGRIGKSQAQPAAV